MEPVATITVTWLSAVKTTAPWIPLGPIRNGKTPGDGGSLVEASSAGGATQR